MGTIANEALCVNYVDVSSLAVAVFLLYESKPLVSRLNLLLTAILNSIQFVTIIPNTFIRH